MATSRVIAAVFSLTVASVLAKPPSGFTLRHSEQSPDGDMLVQDYYRAEKDGGHVVQIWLASVEHSDDAALLFQHRRSADVVFSPDESRIAINHGGSSTDAVVIVFERVSGVHYKEIIPPDIVREKAFAAFQQSFRQPSTREFDHIYAECILWSADSSEFLVRLHGHESGVASLQNYCCIFRLADRSISLDLGAFNKHSFDDHK